MIILGDVKGVVAFTEPNAEGVRYVRCVGSRAIRGGMCERKEIRI